MADIILKNYGDFAGAYAGETLDFSTSESTVTIVTGLSATKTADKTLWVNGPLTYTVIITNDSGADFETPVFTDTLQSDITLIADTVMYNGVAATYTFDDATGLLTINLETLASSASGTLTFQVALK